MLAHTSRKPQEVVGRMQPTANRGLWEYTVEKVAVNAVMSGAKPEYFPVILALAASEVIGARQHVEFGRGDGRRERPDPPRDQHELRASARWAPTITPTRRSAARTGCSRRICKAARCRAKRSWVRKATTTPTTTSRSPRTKNAARGSRCTCRRASRRPTAWSAFSTAAARRRSVSACARNTGASTCKDMLRRRRRRTRRRAYCSIRSRRSSSSIAAAS